MKSEPINNLLQADDYLAVALSFGHPRMRPGRSRPRLTPRQKKDVATDWTYFEVELFAHLAERAPEMLVGPWRLLLALVRSSDQYLVYQAATIGEIEDGLEPELRHYIDIDALHANWAALKERVWLIS